MKRFLSVFLSFTITICLPLSPASAEEAPTFTDVSPGDWFAPYVEICAGKGLITGVGEGRFDPQGTVTAGQAAALAARVHRLQTGGDGTLSPAPEDYGVLTVEFENGVILRLDGGECYNIIIPMSGALGARLTGEKLAALDWLGQEASPAKVTAFLGELIGPLPCSVFWSDQKGGAIRFAPTGTEEEQQAFRQMHRDFMSFRRVPAGHWLRDSQYYLEHAGLTDYFVLRPSQPDSPAARADFAEALSAVAPDLLTPINEISDYPDSTSGYLKEIVLSLYNAGILTGKDEFGTFDPEGTLTRAECAAMLARLMEPDLRLTFQPAPAPERYGYTLTYLMDDPMTSHTVTYPVLPILTEDGLNNGFLTLEGTLIPWPGGEKPISLFPMGDLYWCSFWIDGVEHGGLIDKTGTFVLPLQSQFYYAYPTQTGSFMARQLQGQGPWTLLDGQGQVLKELGDISQEEAEALYPFRLPAAGFAIDTWGGCYVNEAGHPVSETFDWVGHLTDDNQGFVGKDGKIYRIQFTEKEVE